MPLEDLGVERWFRRLRGLTAGNSIKPRGCRTSRPSRVARFNSVSLIASGSVKLFFRSVIAACKSGWPSELINSWVVGVPNGEGDGVVDLVGAGGPLAEGVIEGPGD